jgi:hypothetical protein
LPKSRSFTRFLFINLSDRQQQFVAVYGLHVEFDFEYGNIALWRNLCAVAGVVMHVQ